VSPLGTSLLDASDLTNVTLLSPTVPFNDDLIAEDLQNQLSHALVELGIRHQQQRASDLELQYERATHKRLQVRAAALAREAETLRTQHSSLLAESVRATAGLRELLAHAHAESAALRAECTRLHALASASSRAASRAPTPTHSSSSNPTPIPSSRATSSPPLHALEIENGSHCITLEVPAAFKDSNTAHAPEHISRTSTPTPTAEPSSVPHTVTQSKFATSSSTPHAPPPLPLVPPRPGVQPMTIAAPTTSSTITRALSSFLPSFLSSSSPAAAPPSAIAGSDQPPPPTSDGSECAAGPANVLATPAPHVVVRSPPRSSKSAAPKVAPAFFLHRENAQPSSVPTIAAEAMHTDRSLPLGTLSAQMESEARQTSPHFPVATESAIAINASPAGPVRSADSRAPSDAVLPGSSPSQHSCAKCERARHEAAVSMQASAQQIEVLQSELDQQTARAETQRAHAAAAQVAAAAHLGRIVELEALLMDARRQLVEVSSQPSTPLVAAPIAQTLVADVSSAGGNTAEALPATQSSASPATTTGADRTAQHSPPPAVPSAMTPSSQSKDHRQELARLLAELSHSQSAARRYQAALCTLQQGLLPTIDRFGYAMKERITASLVRHEARLARLSRTVVTAASLLHARKALQATHNNAARGRTHHPSPLAAVARSAPSSPLPSASVSPAMPVMPPPRGESPPAFAFSGPPAGAALVPAVPHGGLKDAETLGTLKGATAPDTSSVSSSSQVSVSTMKSPSQDLIADAVGCEACLHLHEQLATVSRDALARVSRLRAELESQAASLRQHNAALNETVRTKEAAIKALQGTVRKYRALVEANTAPPQAPTPKPSSATVACQTDIDVTAPLPQAAPPGPAATVLAEKPATGPIAAKHLSHAASQTHACAAHFATVDSPASVQTDAVQEETSSRALRLPSPLPTAGTKAAAASTAPLSSSSARSMTPIAALPPAPPPLSSAHATRQTASLPSSPVRASPPARDFVAPRSASPAPALSASSAVLVSVPAPPFQPPAHSTALMPPAQVQQASVATATEQPSPNAPLFLPAPAASTTPAAAPQATAANEVALRASLADRDAIISKLKAERMRCEDVLRAQTTELARLAALASQGHENAGLVKDLKEEVFRLRFARDGFYACYQRLLSASLRVLSKVNKTVPNEPCTAEEHDKATKLTGKVCVHMEQCQIELHELISHAQALDKEVVELRTKAAHATDSSTHFSAQTKDLAHKLTEMQNQFGDIISSLQRELDAQKASNDTLRGSEMAAVREAREAAAARETAQLESKRAAHERQLALEDAALQQETIVGLQALVRAAAEGEAQLSDRCRALEAALAEATAKASTARSGTDAEFEGPRLPSGPLKQEGTALDSSQRALPTMGNTDKGGPLGPVRHVEMYDKSTGTETVVEQLPSPPASARNAGTDEGGRAESDALSDAVTARVVEDMRVPQLQTELEQMRGMLAEISSMSAAQISALQRRLDRRSANAARLQQCLRELDAEMQSLHSATT
jgi:hypothetical protein